MDAGGGALSVLGTVVGEESDELNGLCTPPSCNIEGNHNEAAPWSAPSRCAFCVRVRCGGRHRASCIEGRRENSVDGELDCAPER